MADDPIIHNQHHGDSFVVRIWWEKEGEGQVFWRGWVQHAVTGKSRYFDRLIDLLAFMETHTGHLKDSANWKDLEEGPLLCQDQKLINEIKK